MKYNGDPIFELTNGKTAYQYADKPPFVTNVTPFTERITYEPNHEIKYLVTPKEIMKAVHEAGMIIDKL